MKISGDTLIILAAAAAGLYFVAKIAKKPAAKPTGATNAGPSGAGNVYPPDGYLTFWDSPMAPTLYGTGSLGD